MPQFASEDRHSSGRSWDLVPRKSTSFERMENAADSHGVNHKKSESSVLASMLAGASAGVVARIPCHPIDTIKAKLQVDIESGGTFFRSLRTTFRTEGVAGLYRGIGIAALGSCPAACLYFSTYEATKEHLRSQSWLEGRSFLADFTAGFVAEVVSCVLWVPIDVVKERLQVQSTLHGPAASSAYRGSLHAFCKIWRVEGARGLYRGYGATLASFGPFSALYFLFYEQLKAQSMRVSGVECERELSAAYAFVNGAGAGALAGFITNGLDMAKLRLQVQRSLGPDAGGGASGGVGIARPAAQGSSQARRQAGGRGVSFYYSGMGEALLSIVRHEGFSGLFKGAGARVGFFSITQAVSIACFEHFKHLYSAILLPAGSSPAGGPTRTRPPAASATPTA